MAIQGRACQGICLEACTDFGGRKAEEGGEEGKAHGGLNRIRSHDMNRLAQFLELML